MIQVCLISKASGMERRVVHLLMAPHLQLIPTASMCIKVMQYLCGEGSPVYVGVHGVTPLEIVGKTVS
jgi:hypothetical protein